MAFKKGTPEAKAWGEKMRKGKINVQKLKNSGGTPAKSNFVCNQRVPIFIKTIVQSYFPKARLNVIIRKTNYAVEIDLEGDVRAFTVDKITADIEIQNWCRKIRNNIEGKSDSKVFGIDIQTGGVMKKVPSSLGDDAEFFERE